MDLALDPTTGDLDLSQGVHFVTGGDAIRQDIARRLRIILGEYFMDTRVGIDYFGYIFVKNPSMMIIQSMFRRAMLGTSGIKSVKNLRLSVDNTTRQLLVSYIVEADTGLVVEYKDLIL